MTQDGSMNHLSHHTATTHSYTFNAPQIHDIYASHALPENMNAIG
jgi:hypothetical protein